MVELALQSRESRRDVSFRDETPDTQSDTAGEVFPGVAVDAEAATVTDAVVDASAPMDGTGVGVAVADCICVEQVGSRGVPPRVITRGFSGAEANKSSSSLSTLLKSNRVCTRLAPACTVPLRGVGVEGLPPARAVGVTGALAAGASASEGVGAESAPADCVDGRLGASKLEPRPAATAVPCTLDAV